MVAVKILPVVLGFFTLASAQVHSINYNVVNLLNNTHTMGVIVDNVTYPLSPKSKAPILYSGDAPVAQNGYRYVKIDLSNNNTEVEPFFRNPVQKDTVNEFFKRSWNSREIAKLPTVYPPMNIVHRIKSKLFPDGQIATLHFIGNQTEIDRLHTSNATESIHVVTNMTYVGLTDTFRFQDVELSLAGRSSRWLPKLSYNVKLHDDDLLYNYRRVKLRALNTDPSYIREQLAYDVIKSVGVLSSEFTYCRVFLNDREIGLFGMIDTFKDPWLANVFANGDPDYKDNPLYQGVYTSPQAVPLNQTSDLSYHENVAIYGLGQYKIKQLPSYTGGEDDYKPLQEFTKFIHDMPDDAPDAVKKWQKKLNTDSFLRSMALEVLLCGADGYMSMADNFYVYENPADGAYVYIPSDMDLTQGSTIYPLEIMASGNYSTFPNLYTRPLITKLLKVPEFKQQFEELLVNITLKLTNPVVMNDRINNLVDMLEEDVEWDMSLPRVADNLISTFASDDDSDLDSAVGDAVGNDALDGLNQVVAKDFGRRLNETMDFREAVNGHIDRPSLTGVKQWYQMISKSILAFYNVPADNITSTTITA